VVEVMENRDYTGSTHFFLDIGNDNLLAFFDFPGLGLEPVIEALGGIQHVAISVDAAGLASIRARLDAEGVRDEKVKALRAVAVPIAEDGSVPVALGQYRDGWLAGREVPGYLQEPGVAPGSTTETFVALQLHVDNWRWAGVPIFVRTGKRLPKRVSEVAIVFAFAATAYAFARMRARRDLWLGGAALTVLLIVESYVGGLIKDQSKDSLTAVHVPIAMVLMGLAVWLPLRAMQKH